MLKAKKTTSRAGALLMAAALTVQLLPGTAFAVEGNDNPGSRTSMSLNYSKIDDTSGKLWIGNIGETVFDGITYSKSQNQANSERANAVAVDENGVLTVGDGYMLSDTGRPAQAVTFEVEASYYDSADVLWVENFEGAAENDTGTGQKFHGVYGAKASGDYKANDPVRMPVVIDPTKARAGEKSITQAAQGAQSEGVYAEYDKGALDADAWATMWYYDDGSNMGYSSQYAFMGGVITKGWTQGQFNGTIGTTYQPNVTIGDNYGYRYTGGKYAAATQRTEGWHKFQWKIGETNTVIYADGTEVSSTNVSPANWANFGGFHITFNWNNLNTPFRNKHFIDSFSVVKAGADGDPVEASQTFKDTKTVYVISENDVLSVGYTQDADNSKGTIALGNVDGIGAVIDSCTFTPDVNLDGKVTISGNNSGTATVTPETGFVLSNSANKLAQKVTVKVKAGYHYGSDANDKDTFVGEVVFYYDIDESNTEVTDLTGTGPREVVDLNGAWQFGGKNAASAAAVTDWKTVTVPHDWNADTGDGVKSRENGTFWYRKTLTLSAEKAAEYNQRSAYLEFDAVGMEAHVFLNGTEVGSHKGGWSAFKIDVTGRLKAGENVIEVSANNERRLNGDIAPLHGDFDNASGINRDVRLVMTSQVHLDQLDYGSHGVYISPVKGSGSSWNVNVTAMVANDTVVGRDVTVKAVISHPTSFDDVLELGKKGLLRFDPKDMYDPSGAEVGTKTVTAKATRQSATEVELTVPVSNPKLWNGVESPYRYVAKIEVYEGTDTSGALLDSYECMIGFRSYDAVRTDSNGYGTVGDGFYLNGEFYPLRGMAFHEDWPGFGRALTKAQIAKDVAVLYEMGANWTRVSHYPHNEYCYELLSQYGIACSAEIPLVDGVSLVNRDGSYTSSKTSGVLSKSFKETTLDQFQDMVKQNYNQPAILGWLMQNELGGGTYGQGTGADAKAAQSEMITALNNLSHEIDPGRKTVMAMSLSHCYEFESDWLLWNSYPGWYDSSTTGIGYFIDGYANSTAAERKRPTGASEYGAGVNPFHQTDYIRGETSFTAWNGTGKAFHPEPYGNDRNEQSLREINARPFLWATGGWIMFDFSASARNEGGRTGTNDKGLVYKYRPTDSNSSYKPGDENTLDGLENLLLRKDGFYLYQANLNSDVDVTYIAEGRYEMRQMKSIKATVYSNAPVVELYQNGRKIGTMEATEHVAYTGRNTVDNETASCIFKFDVILENGGNTMVAKGLDKSGNVLSEDTVVWQYGEPEELNIKSDVFAVNNAAKAVMLTGEGRAENIAQLVFPLNPGVEHSYQVLTADQQPVSSGAITSGMKLEVTWGTAKRIYTFQQPYISAMKNVTVDGAASAEAAKAVDFKEDTCWEAGDNQAHSLVIDLGKKYVLTEIKVNWANADGKASAYTVQTSDDGKVWNTVVNRTANKIIDEMAQDELQSYGRYVKLNIAAGSSPRISEIQVYGWMVSLKEGENRIYVSEAERIICVPTDITDFHTGGTLTGGMSFDNVGPLLVVEGNCEASHQNDTDYSLDENHSKFVVTDTLGRKINFNFKFFTGKQKPTGPFELAMGKPVSCSSVQSSSYPGTNVTEENNNRWNAFSQGKNGLDEWVMVDLGTECTLSSVQLHFPTKSTGVTSDRSYPYEVWIGSSMDSLEKVIDKSNNTDITGIFTFTTEVAEKTARFVKVRVTGNSTGYQPGLNRIYVKGTEGGANVPVTGIKVLKGDTVINDSTITVYTNASHADHSVDLTTQVTPEDATDKTLNITRLEGAQGKIELVRHGDGTATITAISGEENVGEVTIEVASVTNPEVKAAFKVRVVRKLENPVSISINGVNDPSAAPKFGQTLEADINQLKMTDKGKAALSYQWKRDGSEISSANAKTYTLTEADIGATISVDVTADPSTYYEGTQSATRGQAVVKADGPTIPGSTIYGVKTTAVDSNDGKITGFGADYAKYEYKAKEAAGWTAVEDTEVTGLASGEYQVRIKETATHMAGTPINVTVPAYDADVHMINIDPNMANGTVTRSVGQAEAGTTITLTVKPDTGYELDSLTVTDADGGDIAVAEGADGTYTFTMSGMDVTVKAEFKKLSFTITHILEHLTCSKNASGDSHEVEYGDMAVITLEPDEGYTLPARDAIKITNADGIEITGYTIDDNGTITITGGVTSNLTITAAGVPKICHVSFTVTNGITADGALRSVGYGEAYSATLKVMDGYSFPKNITMTLDGAAFTDFTYDSTTGVISIAEGKLTGELLVITAAGAGSSSGDSGSSGSSGSSSGSGSSTSSTTVKNPDGSTTTITENKATGTVTETTRWPDGSQTTVETKKDGTVTTTEIDKAGNKTTTVVKPDGSSVTTVTQKGGASSTVTTDSDGKVEAVVKLPAAAVSEAQKNKGTISLPIPELEAAKNVEAAPAITVSTGSKEPVKVEIPVSSPTPGTVAVLVKADGTREIIKTSVPTADGVVVELTNGATVKLVDNSKSFADVPAQNWAKAAVDFVSARELFSGTGENTFSPSTPMTRAMLMTVLARLDGVDINGGANWYEKGVNWAVANGVSDGTNPESGITREQLVSMLWRYAGSPVASGDLSRFPDAAQTSGYAQEAMRWAVENGIVSGFSNGQLGPKGQATRAQVAQMLKNFIGR